MKPEFYKLLDQMVEYEEIMDARAKLNSKAEDRVGDSWMLCHLKLLKELSEEE